MRRRELLRLLAVTGLAGCTTGIERPEVADLPEAVGSPTPRPGTTATPSPSPAPSPSPSPSPPVEQSPSPSPSPAPSPSPEPTPSPSPEPSPDGATVEEPSATPEPSPEPTPSPEPPRSPEPPPDPTSEPPAPEPRVVVAVGRDALGLPPPRPGGRTHRITGLALHHTANPTASARDGPARFRSITAGHRDQGWIDAAYHWGVDVGGTIYELRDESLAGDTNTGYDPAGWFLVVCEGNFEESAPPPAMLEAVADLFAYASARYGVAPSTLRGHRDLAATLCPGANLQGRLAELRRAVERRLARGGVRLRIDDDPARVAAIEG